MQLYVTSLFTTGLREQFLIFVRIDMEGSAYTEQTVDITLRMHKQYEHVGTVIQSCMHSSKKDVEQLIAQGVRVRLVKGAYKEPKTVAFQQKSEVDHNFVRLMTMLIQRGNYQIGRASCRERV